MDDFSSKLRKLFKPKPKVFRGKGNVLGRAEEASAPRQQQPTPAPPRRSPGQPAVQDPAKSPGPRLGAPAPPSASPVHLPNKQVTGLEQRSVSTVAPTDRWAHSTDDAEGRFALDNPDDDLQLQTAVAELQSSDKAQQSCEVLGRVLRNILAEPCEPKYRRLRLTNPRISQTIVDVNGAIDLLQACGFELVFEEGAEGGTEGFAVLPEHCDLSPLHVALRLLGQAGPAGGMPPAQRASSGASSDLAASSAQPQAAPGPKAGARQPADTRPRNTQVLLPAGVDAQPLPDWIFERSPAELKAAAAAARKRQDLEQTLMTRAMRERLANGGKQDLGGYAYATVRIRLPEGLVLQGEFNAGEPVSALFEWVAGCLREPGATYELVGPDRRPLAPGPGSLRAAQLVPSALLNFRRLARDPQRASVLRDDLLRAAR